MSRAKKILIFVTILDILALCGVAFAYYTHINSLLELKKTKVNVEFGESISLDASDYLKKSVSEDIIKKTKVTYQEDKVEGKDYDKVGRYTVRLTYKKEVAKVRVSVVDTKKPKFNKINTFESIRDVEINWSDYIKATDLSEVTIEIDDSDVDIYNAGEYVLIATAKDESGNERKKEIKVVVNGRPENMYDHTIEADESTGIVTVTAVIGSSTNRGGGGTTNQTSRPANVNNNNGNGSSSEGESTDVPVIDNNTPTETVPPVEESNPTESTDNAGE